MWDLYNKSELTVHYMKSKDQIEDTFTKALPTVNFVNLVSRLGHRKKCVVNFLCEDQSSREGVEKTVFTRFIF